MCGIAGWVDFTRAPGGGALQDIDRMLAPVACRGPDASGVWRGSSAILGHRRLAVIDLQGGVQPMTDPVGVSQGARVALAYSGEVYNFAELRVELEGLGHRFVTRSDTEVVLRAWLQWSETFVDRLEGMFAFALWDEATRSLVLVRDRLGVKPLVVAPLANGVVFGSEPKAVLAHPAVTATVDTEGLCDLLGLAGTPGLTPFRDIRHVEPGTITIINDGGIRVRRYWRLESREHVDDLDTTVATVRHLLAAAVTEQTVADVPLCALLSGGLDSSAIAALAGPTDGALRTFAVDFVGAGEDFRSSDFRPDRDSPYATEVADFLGTDHRTIELAASSLSSADARFAVMDALDVPCTFGDVDTSLLLLFREVRRHSTVALSGESADELFGGYSWFHDQQQGVSGFPWLSQMQIMPAELLNPDVRKSSGFEEYRADRLHDARAEVAHLDGDSADERRMREMIYLNLTRWLPILLDRKDRLSMACGLEVRVPFCDRRLVEYVYNVPWAWKALKCEPKALLKRAVSGLVPPSVLRRRKSPYPTTADRRYESALRGRVQELCSSDSPALEVVDRAGLEEMLQRPEGSFDSQLTRNGMETALILDGWFRRHATRLP